MSISEQEWKEEQERVDEVIRVIDKRMEVLDEQAGVLKEDIVDIRKNFWDDVKLNFTDAGEAAETYRSMKQQADILTEREHYHRVTTTELKKLKRLKQSPYFGRIDFHEDGERKSDQIYLGIGSLLDEKEEEFLVYDWRAPVSSLYYDYGPGPAKYKTPSGTIEGEMELKRQFMIRDGEIKSLFDTGVTIGDELLQEVLGKQSDSQMKSIVATIQQEQNLIIRDEKHRMLVVQGAAGSGKTSAALQRVAYLLYRYREILRADQIVLFSPNPMFNSYVSTVLPELGEENMQQTTFQEYLQRRLGKQFDIEDPFAQMEYTLSAMDEPGYEARVEGIRFKASTHYMDVMGKYVEALEKEGMMFRDVKFRGEVIFSAERVRDRFYSFDSYIAIPNRMKLLSEELLEELEQRFEEEKSKPWVEEEIDLLEKEDYARAYKQLRNKKRFSENSFDDYDAEKDALAEMVVRKRFKPLRARIKRFRFLDMTAVYRQLFSNPAFAARLAEGKELPGHWVEICHQTMERLEQKELAYEDATPYLYLKEQLEGFQTNTSVRHVFVDEAQDYSAFQFAFLKRLFPYCRMTALGDLNQAIFTHSTIGSGFDPLLDLYGEEETNTIILTRSYRSTRQIVEFTRSMLPGGEQIQPFNRNGDKPTVIQVADEASLTAKIADRIRSLQAAGHTSIAVICKTAKESSEAYERLQNELPIRLVGKETTHFEHGTLVIPSYLAKGVEFDAVIIYNASETVYCRETERKLFYTACTRAMHELFVYGVGELTQFVKDASTDTYILER